MKEMIFHENVFRAQADGNDVCGHEKNHAWEAGGIDETDDDD